jgi:hypothetical protein
MKNKFLPIILLLILSNNYLFCQVKEIDKRYKGGEIKLKEFIEQNLEYPVNSVMNKKIGYSITGITITPAGKILEISTTNSIDDFIEKDIKRVLSLTKKSWLKSDSVSENETFYIQIAYTLSNKKKSPEIVSPVKEKYNFIEPVVITALGLNDSFSPATDEYVAIMFSEYLKKKKYEDALIYIDELIRRNPFNKELYQLRISINKKLNRNDLVIRDVQKLENFIPGVSLDELIN